MYSALQVFITRKIRSSSTREGLRTGSHNCAASLSGRELCAMFLHWLIGRNSLTGPLPTELGVLTDIEYLLTHIAYEDGDKEDLDMSKEKYEGAALGDKTVGNYLPKARAFMAFCEAENREWLPATGATVRL
ncbi:hypothetical protein CYMTET_11041 [Cymbomonas tetramitiformis]|uniref:Uncharacterized protein n=1 Tax=Cymbomonas tetramitiformis TaxID=36881 RepID=A0AAE0GNI4_9CHLO|nr:hypothetical protein CYMTET_11041 [Cymbomonas tetramitiformis]